MRNSPSPEDWVAGRNPVLELLSSKRPVDKLLMLSPRSGSLLKIAAMARERGIPIKDVSREKLDFMFREINHQGVAALAAACEYVEPEDLLAIAKERNEPLLVVVADGIEDPHNLGAVIRSAEAAGAHGIIIPKRQGAGVTTAVMRSSAGAAGHLAVARVANIASAVNYLKEQGVWIYAADMGGKDWSTVDYTGPVALVLGSEGEGVSRLVKERSDFVVGIPMRKPGSSLNVSVASGIILFEIARQRLHLPTIEPGRG